MDLKSALCRYLINQQIVGQRVYQKRLPQRDGSITGGLPAIVVSLISDRQLSSSHVIINGQRCLNRRHSARVQIDLIGTLPSDPLEQIKERLITWLSLLKGDLGGIKVESITFDRSYDQDLLDVGHDRIVSDYKIVYVRS